MLTRGFWLRQRARSGRLERRLRQSGSLVVESCFLAWLKPCPTIPMCAIGKLAAPLLQLTIHMRHLQNLITYRAMATNEVTGCIEYSRGLILRISAYQVFAFAGLYLILFAITERWFLLGGTVSCASVGVKHLRLSRKTMSPATTAQLDSVSS